MPRIRIRFAALAAVLLATTAPAHAHFLWLKADCQNDDRTVRLYFAEAPEADGSGLIARVADARIEANGTPLATRREEDALAAEVPSPAPDALETRHDYGIIERDGTSFRLLYSAYAQFRPVTADQACCADEACCADDTNCDAGEFLRLSLVTRDGAAPVVLATRRGKPVAGATVKAIAIEDGGQDAELTTDEAGRVEVPGLASGTVAILARAVEPAEGERDGRAFSEVRRYATLTVSPEQGQTQSGESESADAALRRAHDARVSWGPGFPGFTANMTVRLDDLAYEGSLDVAPDGKVTLELPEGDARDWASKQLRSIVMHRGLNGPTRLDPGASFAEPANEHSLGRLINLPEDAAMGSAYRIKGDEILEVNRTMGSIRFSDRILANTRNAEGKLLPLSYSVTYWDTKTGKLLKVETFHATWERVGRLDLPKTHTQVVSKDADDPAPAVRQIEFRDLRLKGDPTTTAARD